MKKLNRSLLVLFLAIPFLSAGASTPHQLFPEGDYELKKVPEMKSDELCPNGKVIHVESPETNDSLILIGATHSFNLKNTQEEIESIPKGCTYRIKTEFADKAIRKTTKRERCPDAKENGLIEETLQSTNKSFIYTIKKDGTIQNTCHYGLISKGA